MTPQSYCHRVCKESGSNFVYTFYLFGRQRRQALEAFYAFCRTVDDAVDNEADPKKVIETIRFWKEEVMSIYEGSPRHLVSQALKEAVFRYQIPKQYLHEIVAGCEMDLHKKTYATFEELEDYCFKVASCVGLVCLPLFGAPLTETNQHAATFLGKALQITNILRDVATDLKRGRIYLPQEDLKKFHVTEADLQRGDKMNLNLLDLFYFEIDRARKFFDAAWRLFPAEKKERHKLLAAFLMGRFYEALLDKITRDPLQVFQTKIRVTGGEKIKIALNEMVRLI